MQQHSSISYRVKGELALLEHGKIYIHVCELEQKRKVSNINLNKLPEKKKGGLLLLSNRLGREAKSYFRYLHEREAVVHTAIVGMGDIQYSLVPLSYLLFCAHSIFIFIVYKWHFLIIIYIYIYIYIYGILYS